MTGSSRLLVVAAELAQSTTAIPIRLDHRTVGLLRRLDEGGVPEADLRAVWTWAAESEDEDAAWLRQRGLVRWQTLAAPDRWGHRVRQARAWLARGRVSVPAEPRARGRPVEAPTSSIAGLLDRLTAIPTPIDVEVISAKHASDRGRV